MKVVLAGYSLDHELVEGARQGKLDADTILTPETLSAAYARISRDPRPVTELRAQSRRDVLASRKSNRIIVFGLGHHSVAEHVQLNFDILGLSRLAIEALQEARLCAYTEKSQRYITLDGDYVVPDEYGETEREVLDAVVAQQVALYNEALPKLHEYQKLLHPEMNDRASDRSTVEGWAKEDARYALCLATQAQLGFSANARNLEHVIRKLRYHQLAEVRTLSQKLYDAAAEVVPSLIILSDPEKFRETFKRDVSDEFLSKGPLDVAKAARAVLTATEAPNEVAVGNRCGDVILLGHTEDPDVKVAASLLFSASDRPYGECLARAHALRQADRAGFEGLILESMKRLTGFDPPPRAFETVELTFEMELSSSAFAQLKRHRLMTILKQPYDPALPCTYPDSVEQTGLHSAFETVFEASAAAFTKVAAAVGAEAAEYLLTNAHRRRVLVTCNLRELYHIARLRMDQHAQWDIQRLSGDMVSLVREVAPVAARLATGKDQFAALRDEAYC